MLDIESKIIYVNNSNTFDWTKHVLRKKSLGTFSLKRYKEQIWRKDTNRERKVSLLYLIFCFVNYLILKLRNCRLEFACFEYFRTWWLCKYCIFQQRQGCAWVGFIVLKRVGTFGRREQTNSVQSWFNNTRYFCCKYYKKTKFLAIQ